MMILILYTLSSSFKDCHSLTYLNAILTPDALVVIILINFLDPHAFYILFGSLTKDTNHSCTFQIGPPIIWHIKAKTCYYFEQSDPLAGL